MVVYKVFITRKMVVSGEDESLHQAEGERIHRLLRDPEFMGVFIMQAEFHLTVERVKRLERLLGSVFEERVSVLY